jgi:hypothetical protein
MAHFSSVSIFKVMLPRIVQLSQKILASGNASLATLADGPALCMRVGKSRVSLLLARRSDELRCAERLLSN